jgi:hypothetical protein
MIEMALRAKYPPKTGEKLIATNAWAKFYNEHVLDATTNTNLCIAAAALSRKLGCTENQKVIMGNLETLYNRLSHPVHHRTLVGYRNGLYCGGDETAVGCANAIAVKMLQDDPVVKSTGALAFDIIFLDQNCKPKLIFTSDDRDTIIDFE